MLHAVNTQHGLQRIGPSAIARLGIKRLDDSGHILPWQNMTPAGMLAGAILVGDALNTVTREAARQLLNETASEGILADGAMTVAEFMGFSRDVGLGIFNATTLAANVYGVFGLTGKAEAWRLFRYLPGDYYRKVETMSPGRLTMKVLGWGVSAKVVLELLTHDQNRSR